MSEESGSEPLEQPEGTGSSLPDVLSKGLTRSVALQLGLVVEPTEYQQSLRADLVFRVPPGVNVEGTLFDFFRAINIVEFKSENDAFTLAEFVKNEIRVDLQFLQDKAKNFDDILNVYVLSPFPQRFFEQAQRRGLALEAVEGKPWLWHGQVGFQDILFVICRNLPIEERFYPWLNFAPSETRRWRDYVQTVVRQDRKDMMEVLTKLRPKEYIMNTEDLIEQLRAEGLITPKMDAKYEKDLAEGLEYGFKIMIRRKSPHLGELLSNVPLEERMAGLKPGDRLAGLKPEDWIAGMSQEERQKLLKLLTEQAAEEPSKE